MKEVKPVLDMGYDSVKPVLDMGCDSVKPVLDMGCDSVKPVLDMTCGARMMWFDKNDPRAMFCDNRTVDETLCDGRKLTIKPDLIADFRDLPFPNNTFNLVVFDPPHLKKAGEKSWLAKKYGVLSPSWKDDLKAGFTQGFRVLKPGGVLVFKWNENQIKVADIIALAPYPPLFGQRSGRTGMTHWIVFLKPDEEPAN